MGAETIDKTAAVEEGKKDSKSVSEQSSIEKASQTLIKEVTDFDSKNQQNPEARKTYHETINKELENMKLIPALSIEYLNASGLVTEKGLSSAGLQAQIQEANTKGDLVRVKMLSTIAQKYDDLKKLNIEDGDEDVISRKDLEAARPKENSVVKEPNLVQFTGDTKVDQNNRVELAKKIDPKFNPDANLTKGQTLYDMAKQKLINMDSIKPQDQRKPITNKEVFAECANIMNRTGGFTPLDPTLASEKQQKSIPLDWNKLTLKTALKLYSEDDLQAILKNKEANLPKKEQSKVELTEKQIEEQKLQAEKLEREEKVRNDEKNKNSILNNENTENKKKPEKLEIMPEILDPNKLLEIEKNDENRVDKTEAEKQKDANVKSSFESNGITTTTYNDNSMVKTDVKGRVTFMHSANNHDYSWSYEGDDPVPVREVKEGVTAVRKPNTDIWIVNGKSEWVGKVNITKDTYSYEDREKGVTVGLNRDGSTSLTPDLPKGTEIKPTTDAVKDSEHRVTKMNNALGETYEAVYQDKDPQPIKVIKPNNEIWTRTPGTDNWTSNQNASYTGKLALTEDGYSYSNGEIKESINKNGTKTSTTYKKK